ncbi:hypothetical protein KSP40_PGU016113 [Platanthera guangdongensis]|uniref:FLZ-type domain-containing protein n=1 Tax=Platanthera guangdongensis TaxID=2320717 RepID=A0ABR2LGY1_9ASPA
MLRRRGGVMQKENIKAQKTSDLSSQSCFSSNSLEKMKNCPFFNVPGLFVGKGLQDSDSLKSPTSPLDHRVFSNLGCSFVQSPTSPRKSWDCSRVGLGLVDSLSDETKNILLGSQMRTIGIPTPKISNLSSISMESSIFSPFGSCEKIDDDSRPNDKAKQIYSNPKPNSDFFISDSKSSNPGLLSASLPVSINSIHGFTDSLSASEIELSEDYTCIISHGPNPKKVHIFGDRVLENYAIDSQDSKKEGGGSSHWIVKSLENYPPFPSTDFLSFCCFCKKKLEAGKDIYMYRGEKAFCSCNCREQEMLLEEEREMGMENPATCSSSFHEDLFH